MFTHRVHITNTFISDDDCDVTDDQKEGYKLLLDEGYSIENAIEIENNADNSKKGKFDHFWKAAEHFLSSNDYSVAEERRSEQTSWISPLCVSLSDLHRKCELEKQRMFPNSELNAIPSYEYFRLQFTPRNSVSEVSKRYYGRFDIKFGLQKRTLHKHHVDQHYGAKQFQYLKIMAGKLNQTLVLILK